MAKVQVQIVVSSVAENGDYKGRVFKGWESFTITVKGEPVNKKRQWTMWLDLPAAINKDDIVTFTGDLGTKAGSFEKDGQTYQVVEHSLNNVTYVVNSSAVPIPPSAHDGWNTPATDSGQSPFQIMYIRVYGDPAPQGSKTARMVNGHVVMWESSKKLPGWRESVVMAAKVSFLENNSQTMLGPVSLHCTFYMPRPKSVNRKYPNTAPDLDKLLRGIGDALQIAGVVSNDGQIVAITAKKVYAETSADNGVEIWLTKQL